MIKFLLIGLNLLAGTSLWIGIQWRPLSYLASQEKGFYVDINHPQAQDAPDHGTINRPWQTLEYAFQQLRPGDKLFIRAGTYRNGQIILTGQNSGQATAEIVVRAYPGERVVLRGGEPIEFRGSRWWVISDLIFEGFSQKHIFEFGQSEARAENITIRYCEFRDSTVPAIKLAYAQNILIAQSTFARINSGLAGQGAHAIEISHWAKDITIWGNDFVDNAADGIQLGTVTAPIIRNIVIENNLFRMTTDNVAWGENGVDIKTVQGPVSVSRNTFRGYRPTQANAIGHSGGSHGAGLVIHNGAQNVTVAGNLFIDNTIGLNITDPTEGNLAPVKNIRVVNNLFKRAFDYSGNKYRPAGSGIGLKVSRVNKNIEIWHNTFTKNETYLSSYEASGSFKNNVVKGGKATLDSTSTWVADYNGWTGNTQVPPQLKGKHDQTGNLALDGYLRPKLSSPLLNAGQPLGVATDYDGKGRSDGSPDIGAFEFGGIMVDPEVQALQPGETTTFILQYFPTSDLPATVELTAVNPASTGLTLTLSKATIGQGETVYLTIKNSYLKGMATAPLWYIIPISAGKGQINQRADIDLLINGRQLFLPLGRQGSSW
jgi:hypothetical protein